MTVPNLDAMSEEELGKFWGRYHRARRKDAEALIGDTRKNYTIIASDLANYAINKSCAMSLRKKGEIARATVYEYACESIYERIPQDLRW